LKTLMSRMWLSGRCTEMYRNLQSGSGCICATWRSVDEGMAFKKVVNCSDRKSPKPLGDYIFKPRRCKKERYVERMDLVFVGDNYVRCRQYGRVARCKVFKCLWYFLLGPPPLISRSRISCTTAQYKVFHQDKNGVCSPDEYVANGDQALWNEFIRTLIMKQNSCK
jgi:hypothetical protein